MEKAFWGIGKMGRGIIPRMDGKEFWGMGMRHIGQSEGKVKRYSRENYAKMWVGHVEGDEGVWALGGKEIGGIELHRKSGFGRTFG